MVNNRLNQLRNCFDEWEVDGVFITSEANRRWLSGFKGSAAKLLITADKALLSTDFRYWERIPDEAPDFELFRERRKKGELLDFLNSGRTKRLGIEAGHMSVAMFTRLSEFDEFEWQPLDNTVEPFREKKSAVELALIQRAAEITDRTVDQIPRLLRPGKSELQVAWELEKFMRESGADAVAFDIIVASGPHAALPHHTPDDRVIQSGDSVIVDLGATVEGYKSDLTRTYFIGEASDQFWMVYNKVQEAQTAALEGMCPEMTSGEIDALARDIITGAGYGDNFGHGLGHGIGLEVHENPRLSATQKDKIIEEDVVVTVEPGIYLPGWGGVRIEDLVHLTSTGAQLLSHAAKNPILLD